MKSVISTKHFSENGIKNRKFRFFHKHKHKNINTNVYTHANTHSQEVGFSRFRSTVIWFNSHAFLKGFIFGENSGKLVKINGFNAIITYFILYFIEL